MSVLFLSYRRGDSQADTGRIYDRLVAKFPKNQVFRDVDNMPLGITFPVHLKKVLGKCDVVLVIIGRDWLAATDAQGYRRLDDPSDFVRVEVEVALRANVPVIPVLVSNASMPQAADLPSSIRPLVMRHGMSVRPDPDFGHDMDRLIRGIEQVLKLPIKGKPRPEPNNWTAPSKPQESRQPSSPKPAVGNGCAVAVATVVAVLMSVAVAVFWFSATGTIRIKLDRPQAQVWVDDQAISVGDIDRPLQLRAGVHSLVVTGPDFEPVSDSFTVTRGDNPAKHVHLVPTLIGEMKFVRLPRGTAWGGDGSAKELPKWEEPIAYDVQLAAFCVTQEHWEKIMGDNPSKFSRDGEHKEKVADVINADLKRFPVENVSWNDVQEFLNKLNAQQKGRKWDYRLPTDAEWEYGCRGAASKGDSSWAFYIGKQGTNDLSSDDANFHGKFAAGNAKKGKYLGRPTMVGQYAANILGLYDMHGNVWQWCDDLGIGKVKRCMRGGAWNSEGEQCRAAFRTSQAPGDRFDSVGFRLARVPSK